MNNTNNFIIKLTAVLVRGDTNTCTIAICVRANLCIIGMRIMNKSGIPN